MTASAATTLPRAKRPQTRVLDGSYDFVAACVVGSDGTRTIFIDSTLNEISKPVALKVLNRRASRPGNNIVIWVGWQDKEFFSRARSAWRGR